jgi:hypothetical protein
MSEMVFSPKTRVLVRPGSVLVDLPCILYADSQQVPAALRPSASSALALAREVVSDGGDLTELEDTIAVLDRSFRSSRSVVSAALPGLGGAPAASSSRSERSADSGPVSEATGRMVVEALRSIAEILAAVVRVLLSCVFRGL